MPTRRSHPPALRQGRSRAGRSPASSGGGPAGHGGKAPLTRRGLTQAPPVRASTTKRATRRGQGRRSPGRTRLGAGRRPAPYHPADRGPEAMADLFGQQPSPAGGTPDRKWCGGRRRCGTARMAGDTSRYADVCPKVTRCDTAPGVMASEMLSTVWTIARPLRNVLGRRRLKPQHREKRNKTVPARIADSASAVTPWSTSSRKAMFG